MYEMENGVYELISHMPLRKFRGRPAGYCLEFRETRQ